MILRQSRGRKTPFEVIYVNIDSDDNIFSSIVEKFRTNLGMTEIDLVTCKSVDSTDAVTGDLCLCFFLSRRSYFSMENAEITCGKVLEVCEGFARKSNDKPITMVSIFDCGERPAAPLSDFTYLAMHLENVLTQLTDVDFGSLFAVDYDFNDAQGQRDVTDIEIVDTKEPSFLKYASEYHFDSIRALNENFGQGMIPRLKDSLP